MIRSAAASFLLLAVLGPTEATAGETDSGDSRRSVLDGIYSSVQAERGEVIYPSICGRCHGHRLDGAPDDPDMLPAPPIAGPKFLRKWNGSSLAALYEYLRTSMPAINPGSLSEREYTDVLSYMLRVSNMPSGPDDLRSGLDALTNITIDASR